MPAQTRRDRPAPAQIASIIHSGPVVLVVRARCAHHGGFWWCWR